MNQAAIVVAAVGALGAFGVLIVTLLGHMFQFSNKQGRAEERLDTVVLDLTAVKARADALERAHTSALVRMEGMDGKLNTVVRDTADIKDMVASLLANGAAAPTIRRRPRPES